MITNWDIKTTEWLIANFSEPERKAMYKLVSAEIRPFNWVQLLTCFHEKETKSVREALENWIVG